MCDGINNEFPDLKALYSRSRFPVSDNWLKLSP